MQFSTELVVRLPRCRCRDHGVKTIVPRWAGKHSRFTLFFEAFAIEDLQACRIVKAAASLLGLSWDATQLIMDRAVERGLERREATPIPHVGIAEKSFGRGHDYITVLTDIDGSRVLDVAPERTQAAAEAVLQSLTVDQRQQVVAVAADMHPAYANAAANQTPNAELVHDKLHVAKHLGEAVDQVRRAENKALQTEDDDRLKGTRQLWLFNKAHLSPQRRCRFMAIRQNGLKSARPWAIKEEFRWFWRYAVAKRAIPESPARKRKRPFGEQIDQVGGHDLPDPLFAKLMLERGDLGRVARVLGQGRRPKQRGRDGQQSDRVGKPRSESPWHWHGAAGHSGGYSGTVADVPSARLPRRRWVSKSMS